jgi:hypothetical protein
MAPWPVERLERRPMSRADLDRLPEKKVRAEYVRALLA